MSSHPASTGHTNNEMMRESSIESTSNRRRPTRHSSGSSNRESSSSSSSSSSSNDDNNDHQSRARMMNSLSRVASIKSNPSSWFKLTICSPCRSECGYCHGDRAYVLTQDNPRIFPVGTLGASAPQVEILPVREEDIPRSYRSAGINIMGAQRANHNGHNYGHGLGLQQGRGRGQGQQTVITKDTSSDAYCVHFSNISPAAYLKLINGGWRRSGKLLYLPKNWKSCCACFPIRLDTSPGVFKCSKSQKKILKRFARCLATGQVSGGSSSSVSGNSGAKGGIGNGNATKNSYTSGDKMDSVMEDLNASKPKYCSSKTKRQRRQNDENGCVGSSLNEKYILFAKEILVGTGTTHKHNNTSSSSSSWNLPSSCTLVALLREGARARVDHALSAARAKRTSDSDSLKQLSDDDRLLDKICSFHCARTNVTRTRQQHSPSSVDKNNDGSSLSSYDDAMVDVTLSCKVCPALCGKSKGCIQKLALGKDIIQSFRQDCCIAGYRWDKGMDGSFKGQARERCSISVKSLELHEKSAHINVHVVVSLKGYDFIGGDEMATSKVSTSEKLRSMIGRGVREKSKEKEEKDIFAEFIRRAECLAIDADANLMQNNPQTLPHPPYRLTVRNVPSQISGCMPQVHRLYCKYQTAIHKDSDPFEGPNSGGMRNPGNGNNSNEMSEEEGLISDSDDCSTPTKRPDGHKRHKKITESEIAQIYPEYDSLQQQKIFKSYNDFYRFLCATPLLNSEVTKSSAFVTTTLPSNDQTSPFQFNESDVNIPYGSYHQQYIINDKYLIAVGVVDILPHCLSSVYSFYDPILSSVLNLGKLTALYEIEWVKNARLLRPELKHYVLGYYIHSCQKMRYKAEYKPSELLCPSKGVWVDYEIAKKRIEERSPLRNCCDISSSDKELSKLSDEESNAVGKGDDSSYTGGQKYGVDEIVFDIGQGPCMTLDMNMLSTEGQNIIRPILQTFIDEVGIEISRQCIVKLC